MSDDKETAGTYQYRVRGHWNNVWQATEWLGEEEAQELYRHIRSGNWHQLSLERTDGEKVEKKAGPDSEEGWFDAE